MIAYGRHSINEDDISQVVSALRGDWISTGPLVEEFESALEKVAGAPCVVVSSGTAALHCAYAAINLQPGDEVITPPITFIATQAAAAQFGAKIVFADVHLDTACINPKAVEAAITPRTKAIVAVDYAGHPADLDELRAIANRYGIYLIEDAAHSLGTIYKGRQVGSIADITTFSFFPTKNITTGEGGAIASINSELLENAKRFSRQGLIRNSNEFKILSEGPWHQEVHKFGLNYRLPDILCALGKSQLTRLQIFKQQRSDLFDEYLKNFTELKEIEMPAKKSNVEPMWHLFPIKSEINQRKRIFLELRKRKIGVQVNYFPAHLHPVFSQLGFKKGQFPMSEEFYSREISLPMHTNLTPVLTNKVIQAVKEVCN